MKFKSKYNHFHSRKCIRKCHLLNVSHFIQASVPYVNSLGPSDAIWRWRSWLTMIQVMACSLTAPSHYLNQCWLIISKVLWHSSEDIIIRRFEDTNQLSKIEEYFFKITLRSPKGQWVKSWKLCWKGNDQLEMFSVYKKVSKLQL